MPKGHSNVQFSSFEISHLPNLDLRFANDWIEVNIKM